MRFIKSKPFIAAAVALAALAISGVAFALWSSSGTGSGSTKALSAQTITVNAATATADLYPGFAGGDAYFTLTNANPYPVKFTSMAPGTITSGDPTNCPASNLTVASASGLNLNVAANATSSTQSIADVVTLASAAPDGCQGVSFTIAMTLTGTQV